MANLYQDGKDFVPWHSDDEPMLGKHPLIASLSFGATRTFELRRKLDSGTIDDYKYFKHIKVPLRNGSLITMEGACQLDWEVCYKLKYHLIIFYIFFSSIKFQRVMIVVKELI